MTWNYQAVGNQLLAVSAENATGNQAPAIFLILKHHKVNSPLAISLFLLSDHLIS